MGKIVPQMREERIEKSDVYKNRKKKCKIGALAPENFSFFGDDKTLYLASQILHNITGEGGGGVKMCQNWPL